MATSVRFDDALQNFMVAVQEMEGSRCFENDTFIYANIGSSYARVGFKNSDGDELGTYAFVATKTTESFNEGDIFRKASDAAPANGVRGNIFNPIAETMAGMTVEGPAKRPVGRPKQTVEEAVANPPAQSAEPVAQ